MRPLMSGRVGVLKWTGALILLLGILLFILTIVYFAIDFDETKGPGYFYHIFAVYPTILFAIGGGCSGAMMSRYKGLSHNISARNAAVPLCLMGVISSIMNMIYSGTKLFHEIDQSDALSSSYDDWANAVVALILVNFIFSFFVMLTTIMFMLLGLLWNPSEKSQLEPSLPPMREYPRSGYEYPMKPEPEVRETYYRTGAYGNGYYGGADPYYAGGYRTLPALKY